MRWLYKYIAFLKTVTFLVAGLVIFPIHNSNANTPSLTNLITKTTNYTEDGGYNRLFFDRSPLSTNDMMAEVPSASAVESLSSPESTFGSDDETKPWLQKSLTDSRKCVLCSGPLPQPSVYLTKNTALLPMTGGSAIGAP